MRRVPCVFTICIVMSIIFGCSDSSTGPSAPKVQSGFVVEAQAGSGAGCFRFYDISWRYDPSEGTIRFEGFLEENDDSIVFKGISLYLEGDGVMLGSGAGFLSFLQKDENGDWRAVDRLKWWITAPVEQCPGAMAMYTDLRIWENVDGVDEMSEEKLLLATFGLETK